MASRNRRDVSHELPSLMTICDDGIFSMSDPHLIAHGAPKYCDKLHRSDRQFIYEPYSPDEQWRHLGGIDASP